MQVNELLMWAISNFPVYKVSSITGIACISMSANQRLAMPTEHPENNSDINHIHLQLVAAQGPSTLSNRTQPDLLKCHWVRKRSSVYLVQECFYSSLPSVSAYFEARCPKPAIQSACHENMKPRSCESPLPDLLNNCKHWPRAFYVLSPAPVGHARHISKVK